MRIVQVHLGGGRGLAVGLATGLTNGLATGLTNGLPNRPTNGFFWLPYGLAGPPSLGLLYNGGQAKQVVTPVQPVADHEQPEEAVVVVHPDGDVAQAGDHQVDQLQVEAGGHVVGVHDDDGRVAGHLGQVPVQLQQAAQGYGVRAFLEQVVVHRGAGDQQQVPVVVARRPTLGQAGAVAVRRVCVPFPLRVGVAGAASAKEGEIVEPAILDLEWGICVVTSQ